MNFRNFLGLCNFPENRLGRRVRKTTLQGQMNGKSCNVLPAIPYIDAIGSIRICFSDQEKSKPQSGVFGGWRAKQPFSFRHFITSPGHVIRIADGG